MEKESFLEFQERLGVKLDEDDLDDNLKISTFIYFTSIYCYEQKLNWRRQIVRIKKILDKT